MKPESETIEINTFEELTIHSLERTQEGLAQLSEDCKQCAQSFTEDSSLGMDRLSLLATHLHDFDVFESELCSVFNIDTAQMQDAEGSLKSVEDLFRTHLSELTVSLKEYNLKALIGILGSEIPLQLERFKALLPLVKEHIHEQYMPATP